MTDYSEDFASAAGPPRRRETVQLSCAAGAMSVAYVSAWLALAVAWCAFIVYLFGLGGAHLPIAKAYTHWIWWRLWGPIFTVMPLALYMYWLYQQRKAIIESGSATTTLGMTRMFAQLVLLLVFVSLILIGVYDTVCIFWLGIQDFANCATSTVCSGNTMKNTPTTPGLLILIGLCILVAAMIWLLLVAVYISGAAKMIMAYGDFGSGMSAGLWGGQGTQGFANLSAPIGAPLLETPAAPYGFAPAAPRATPADDETVFAF